MREFLADFCPTVHGVRVNFTWPSWMGASRSSEVIQRLRHKTLTFKPFAPDYLVSVCDSDSSSSKETTNVLKASFNAEVVEPSTTPIMLKFLQNRSTGTSVFCNSLHSHSNCTG